MIKLTRAKRVSIKFVAHLHQTSAAHGAALSIEIKQIFGQEKPK